MFSFARKRADPFLRSVFKDNARLRQDEKVKGINGILERKTPTTLDPLRDVESSWTTALSCRFVTLPFRGKSETAIFFFPFAANTRGRNVSRIDRRGERKRKGKGKGKGKRAIKISIARPGYYRVVVPRKASPLLLPLRLKRISIKSNEILGVGGAGGRVTHCGERESFRATSPCRVNSLSGRLLAPLPENVIFLRRSLEKNGREDGVSRPFSNLVELGTKVPVGRLNTK